MEFVFEEEEIKLIELVLAEYITKNNSTRLKQEKVKDAKKLLSNILFYKKQLTKN